MKNFIFLSLSLFSIAHYGGQHDLSRIENEISQKKILLSHDTITYRKCALFSKNHIEVVVFIDTTLIKAIEKQPENLKLHLTDAEGKPFSMRTTKHWSDRAGRRKEKPLISDVPSVEVLNENTGEIKINFPTKIEIFTKYSGKSMRYDFESDTYSFQISFNHPDFEKIESDKGIIKIK